MGGAGCNAIDRLQNENLFNNSYVTGYAINTDAHSTGGLGNLPYGIGIARKGWLRAKDVLNALDCEAIATWFHS